MQDAQQDGALTIAEAAAQLGVSADTVRRRIRRGELAAVQVHTPNGPAWRVTLGALHSASPTLGSNAHSAVQTLDGAPSPDPAGVVELVHLVDRLQRENRDLAGLVGSLQQRLAFADDRIHMLEAPKDDSPEIAPQRATDNAVCDTTGTPSESPRRVPWWAPWRRVGA